MTAATNTRKPQLVAQDQIIIFEGFESVSQLCFRAPIPFPGNNSGPFSMYETVQGHAWKFFDAVKGKKLSARIVSVHGEREQYVLEGVTIFKPESSFNWESPQGGSPLVVNAQLRWRNARRIDEFSALLDLALLKSTAKAPV
ncbi:hypothetical protein KVG88_30325 [Pseudomonas sp. SWRI74]|uniref:Uncharacterized protein n=1 Tax=Pseudomonas azerbaijanoccidentalis TaxID=2842347 RepID=A0ABS6QZN2_9PSED|nr:hypothetical protein [Pseudomonas azerbaijanoccidentalis]MBV4524373.1 hypothetical protein [Pseudomonas azerbaijanoccidentalis]